MLLSSVESSSTSDLAFDTSSFRFCSSSDQLGVKSFLAPRGMDCLAARSIAVVIALALLSVLIVLQCMPAVYCFVTKENFVQSAFL